MLTRGKSQPPDRPRRFYKAAAAGVVDTGHGVLLDGRPVRTPSGTRLVVASPALAELLAEEWAAQVDHIVYADMPATRLVHTALDHLPTARAAVAADVANYAEADLLCYFAAAPETLVARELAAWGPLLDWAGETLQLQLVRAIGLTHQSQPKQTLDRARSLAAELDDLGLAALALSAALFGSAVLAFALHRGRLTGEEAFDLSRLDETFQEQLWGVDDEAAARAARMRAEAVMLGRWFAALR